MRPSLLLLHYLMILFAYISQYQGHDETGETA